MKMIFIFSLGCISGSGLVILLIAIKGGANFLRNKYSYKKNISQENKSINSLGKRT